MEQFLARIVAVGRPHEDGGSRRGGEERDPADVVELPAPSLELERAQPRVLVLRDILASNDPARLRTIVAWTSCNSH